MFTAMAGVHHTVKAHFVAKVLQLSRGATCLEFVKEMTPLDLKELVFARYVTTRRMWFCPEHASFIARCFNTLRAELGAPALPIAIHPDALTKDDVAIVTHFETLSKAEREEWLAIVKNS